MIQITDLQLQKIVQLRHALHACAEPSGREIRTAAKLRRFLAEHTSLELHACGASFYAVHREPDAKLPAIALRADFDALAQEHGGAAHLCGHDGHAAALCGVALLLEGQKFGRDVILLFQSAEETGQGASGCLSLFSREQVGEIYGAHNLPGFPFGQILTREGTFACASCGVAVHLAGVGTHAAYPELGVSPAGALGALLLSLPALAQRFAEEDAVRATVVGARLGERSFGLAPGSAELWLTLRASRTEPLQSLYKLTEQTVKEAAAAARLQYTLSEYDMFPATVNDPVCAQKVLRACGGATLQAPMRWSEDFGHFLRVCQGAFFGIGAGETHAPLHNPGYEYPDELLAPTMRAFVQILQAT